MSHSSMLVPLIVPMECDDVQLTDQNNSDKECLNVITHSNSSCSSEEITSLSLGKVIALDAKLEHFLQTTLSSSEVGEDSATETSSNKCLRRVSSSSSSSCLTDEDSGAVSADDWRKQPRIGERYQVECIPALNKHSPDYDDAEDQLLWNPSQINQEQVEEYLQSVNYIPPNFHHDIPNIHVRDSEDALLLLTQCNYNAHEATRRYKFRPSPVADELCVWSVEECRQFEHGLTLYGKDFHTIHHNKVKTKSVGEIVKFYYQWKKSERYKSNVKTRLGKKKEVTSTDYVERLLDESGPSTPSQSSPSSPNCTILASYKTGASVTRIANHCSNVASHCDNDHIACSIRDFNESVNEDDLPDFAILDHITPTLLADQDYSPESLAEFDPAIYVAYSDPGVLAPVSSQFVELCCASDSDDVQLSYNKNFAETITDIEVFDSTAPTFDSSFAPDELSSVDNLENVYCNSSCRKISSNQDCKQISHEKSIESNSTALSLSNVENDDNNANFNLQTVYETDDLSQCVYDGKFNKCSTAFSAITQSFSVTDEKPSTSGLSHHKSRSDEKLTRKSLSDVAQIISC